MKIVSKNPKFILRHIQTSDANKYFEAMQDELAKKGFAVVPKTLKKAKNDLEEKIKKFKRKKVTGETFVIEVNGEYAGYVEIDYEDWNHKEHRGRIHYCTHPKFRGKGLTTKAVKLVTQYGFKRYKLKRIIGICRIYNKASARILEKAGYKLEGILRKHTYTRGKYVDDMLWAKIK